MFGSSNEAQMDSLVPEARSNVIVVQPGKWVFKQIIMNMHGFTEDQLKKCRSKHWLEGKHYKKNPCNTFVYSPAAIDLWMEGKL